MTTALFLGNSHVSAYKLAYDELASSSFPTCRFYCARGADLIFTQVTPDGILPCDNANVDEDVLRYGFCDISMEWAIEQYITYGHPM